MLSIYSYSQRKIKKLEVKEDGINVRINHQAITDKTESNGVQIKITPIPANDLNKIFIESNISDGRFAFSSYDKSIESYFLKKKKRKKEKSDLEFLTEGLEWLLDNEKINDEEYDKLYGLVLSDFLSTYKSDSSGMELEISSNPYFLGNRYMNVFRIEFINSSDRIKEFNEAILVKNGNNVVRILSSEFLKTELINSDLYNLSKSLTIERFNLTLPISLPPMSTIVKYFSVPPLDLNSDNLEISLSNFQPLKWKITTSQEKINNKYFFYEFDLAHETEAQNLSFPITYTLLSNVTKSGAYLGDEKLFINSNDIESPIGIFTFLIRNDQLYFARISNLKPSYYLDLSKNKRKWITLGHTKIPVVKKVNK